ncbi:hypothetical protein QWA68_004875 [Fusarium oxysporum]|nr:hypothetical protein QWA68_004875 [Fusarium oxysporum]
MPLTTFSKNFTGSTKDSRSVTQAEAEDYQPRLIRSTTCQTINRCLVSVTNWKKRDVGGRGTDTSRDETTKEAIREIRVSIGWIGSTVCLRDQISREKTIRYCMYCLTQKKQ